MYRGRKPMRRGMRRPYLKRSAFQTGGLVAATMGRPGRSRSNMKKNRARVGSSVVMQYVKAILNPSILGGKIPDDFVQPSASFQLEKEFIVKSSNDSVIIALELGTLPSFGSFAGASTPILPAAAQSVVASAGVDAVTGLDMKFLGSSDDLKTLLGLYKACRLVSAGIKIEYAGTDTTNQGVISVGYLNRNFFSRGEELAKSQSSSGTKYTTYITAGTDQTNYWGLTASSKIDDLAEKLRSLPINAYGPAKNGCFARYFPLDDVDVQFRQLIKTDSPGSIYAASNQYLQGTTETTQGTNWPGNDMNYGAIIVVAQNIASTASFVVKCTCNYEGQIRDEALNLVSTKPSPVAAGAMAKASRMYGRSWQCKVGGDLNSSAY